MSYPHEILTHLSSQMPNVFSRKDDMPIPKNYDWNDNWYQKNQMIEKLHKQSKLISHFALGLKNLNRKINGGNQPCCWLNNQTWLMKKNLKEIGCHFFSNQKSLRQPKNSL
jgi:hypothetical protein